MDETEVDSEPGWAISVRVAVGISIATAGAATDRKEA